jgi:hypothetical protein
MMIPETKEKLWQAINEYAAACGGDTSEKTISDVRMNAVSAIERAIDLLINPAKNLPDLGTTLLKQMKEEKRKAKYQGLWAQAILDGFSRGEAHQIALEGSKED